MTEIPAKIEVRGDDPVTATIHRLERMENLQCS